MPVLDAPRAEPAAASASFRRPFVCPHRCFGPRASKLPRAAPAPCPVLYLDPGAPCFERGFVGEFQGPLVEGSRRPPNA